MAEKKAPLKDVEETQEIQVQEVVELDENKEIAKHEKDFKAQEKSMRQILDEQKKKTILIPENPLNPNEVVPVSLNGVTYAIPTGIECEVPESIYKIWKYSYDETRKAQQKMGNLLNKKLEIY